MYDALGRIARHTDALGQFTNNYVNSTLRPASIQYPNGQRVQFSYYNNLLDQRLQQIQNLDPSGGMLSQFNYAYSRIGQITNWIQQAESNAPQSWVYQYDNVNQLLAAVATTNAVPTKAHAYAYDRLGNRLQETEDGTNRLYTYNALNQLINRTPAVPHPNRGYEWDAEDRLVAIVEGSLRTEFSYDGLGRRVRIIEKNGGVTTNDTRYLWCGGVICEARAADGATVLKRYFGKGVRVGSTNFFYSRDHLGSIREMTTQGGALAARYAFNPYGGFTKTAGAHTSDFTFTGHFTHHRTGLLLAQYRGYDTELGRWLNRDPITEGGGINLYAYAFNDPINLTDPDGQAVALVPLIIGATVAFFVTATPVDEPQTLADDASRVAESAFIAANVAQLVRYAAPGMCRAAAKGTTLELNAATTWGRAETLADHFARHGADVGAKTANEYANIASRFFQEAQAARLPTKIDSQGVIRVFDPKTGTFGSFNPNGTTRTLFKPSSPTYFDRQPGTLVP